MSVTEVLARSSPAEPEPQPRGRGRVLVTLGLLAAAVAGALAAVLTQGGSPSDQPDLIAHSVQRARDAGSARMEFTVAVEGAAAAADAGTGAMRGAGVVDFATPAAQVTLSLAGLGGGTGAARGDLEAEMRVVGSDLYLRAPFATGSGPGTAAGGRWLHLEVNEFNGFGGDDPLSGGILGDPTRPLEVLRAVAGSVETVGSEEVRGVATTHYRALVDLERVAAEAPERHRAALDELLEQAPGATSVPVDLWIDAQGLPRKLHLAVDLSGAEGPRPARVTVTVELFDFGVDARVERPPAAEVVDLPGTGEDLGGAA